MTLDQADFSCIGQVALHCDNDKLCVAINEAWMFDMMELLCDFGYDVETNWDSQDEPWTTLIGGGTFEGCNGRTKRHYGLKRVFIYYAYARYLMINRVTDTANGSVQKTNQFSLPVPRNEVKADSDRYRSMAKVVFDQVEAYLCLNKDEFENYYACNCQPCGCNGCCESGTKARGYGWKGANISKAADKVVYPMKRRILGSQDEEGYFDEYFDEYFA